MHEKISFVDGLNCTQPNSPENSFFLDFKDAVKDFDSAIGDTKRGFELTKFLRRNGIDAYVSKIQNNQNTYFLIEYQGNSRVFSTENEELEDVGEFQKNHGRKYLIPLVTSLEFTRRLWQNEAVQMAPNPVLIVGQFERTGSTWLMDFMDKVGRGQTEPLRQHVSLESPISTWSHIVESADDHSFHSELDSAGFAQIWLSNFLASQYQPEVQITKETNLFFTLGFYLDLFPNESKTIYLKRDIRGILSSFKRSGLYDKWDYSNRYLCLKDALVEHQKQEYLDLIPHIDESNWIDVLLFLYVVNLTQIKTHLFSEDDQNKHRDILTLSYEHLINDKKRELERVQRFLEVNVSADEDSETDNPGLFNTNKRKRNPYDWIDVLSLTEEKYIRDKMAELIEEVDKLFGPQVAQFIHLEAFADGAPEFARAEQEYITNKHEYEVSPACLTRSEIVRIQDFQSIESGYVLTKADGFRQLEDYNAYVPPFNFATRLSTNLEFASFLNWLHKQGLLNALQGHYIYYNCNIPPARGGRIILQNGEYFVEKGYEDHPVNWVSWIGAKAYATWLGARLSTENEWDRVASISDPEFTNYSHNCGNTTPVCRFTPNNLGINDMFGNLRVWTEDWYYPDRHDDDSGISKAVRGLAWNAPDTTAMQRTYKPIYMSARSIGIRLVHSKELKYLSDTDITLIFRELHDLLESGISENETVFSVNKKLGMLLTY